MVGAVALDQVPRLFFRGVDGVPLEGDFGDDFFLDRAPDSACFRVPLNLIANLEVVGRW